jgi:hypothetical protein
MKLRPQIYDKYDAFDKIYDSNSDQLLANTSRSNKSIRESGLIAQEVFYDCPELRHLVSVSDDADPLIYSSNVPDSIDPKEDPIGYYKFWGTRTTSVNYIGLIPYLVSAIQEQQKQYEALRQLVISIQK